MSSSIDVRTLSCAVQRGQAVLCLGEAIVYHASNSIVVHNLQSDTQTVIVNGDCEYIDGFTIDQERQRIAYSSRNENGNTKIIVANVDESTLELNVLFSLEGEVDESYGLLAIDEKYTIALSTLADPSVRVWDLSTGELVISDTLSNVHAFGSDEKAVFMMMPSSQVSFCLFVQVTCSYCFTALVVTRRDTQPVDGLVTSTRLISPQSLVLPSTYFSF